MEMQENEVTTLTFILSEGSHYTDTTFYTNILEG